MKIPPETKNLMEDLKNAENFIYNLLKFFVTLEVETTDKIPSQLIDMVKVNQKSKFLILPILKNLVPKMPKNNSSSKKFKPFSSNPFYFIDIKAKFKVLLSVNQPICIEFICQRKNRLSLKKFILKKGEKMEKEYSICKLIEFIN